MRQLWANFKKMWPKKKYKNVPWNAGKSYTIKGFNTNISKIKDLNREVFEYLDRISPMTWSRHDFSEEVKSDLLLNNLAETFNSFVLETRDKPIIIMMETIRKVLIRRYSKKIEDIKNYNGAIYPKILKKLEKSKKNFIILPSYSRA